ncbi:hypothetical protein Sru01_29600 [Sphaerisporangium rufum]|uniref:Fibronectin type-III domain-containing protein n=1 Tax=Sphaerisporangium rufum TaxID=1381558 RepID=A0A919R2R6_9ACTN|nr:fibronectin type III domain-containing protein [Sphaerisporangium rufum]GII77978.1 hypothetical protein Sru01_29600 [Sphaerisporangium rufum]
MSGERTTTVRWPWHRRRHAAGSVAAPAVAVVTAAVTAAAAALQLIAPPAALAQGNVLFAQGFHGNVPDPAYPVVLPALPSGPATTNAACLTATGGAGPGLHSCADAADPPGAGALRLTGTGDYLTGGVFAATSVPAPQGLDVRFNTYQYGGTGADGIAFVLAAVDPADPRPPGTLGQSGGGLGYSMAQAGHPPAGPVDLPGLSHAYLGVGLDVYGSFSASWPQGRDCADPPFIGRRMPGQVVVRGPGDGTTGYCGLASSAVNLESPPLNLEGPTRADSRVPVQVLINPTGTAHTSGTGAVVPARSFSVVFTDLGGVQYTVGGPLPTVPAGLYPPGWLTAEGTPRQLAFGWVASTGAATDVHEIDDVTVTGFTDVPVLGVAQTAYAPATLAPGAPVTYLVRPSVAAGVSETRPVTVVETPPAGVVPIAAAGEGWECRPPAAGRISCTNAQTPFPAGRPLPPLTVSATVTAGRGRAGALAVTPDDIRTGSVVVAYSDDAVPAVATLTPLGVPPAPPSGLSATPAAGPPAGGGQVVIAGSGLAGATVVRVGTPEQQQAGTAVALPRCPAGPAAGCFTQDASGQVVIAAMPPGAAGPVQITVVTLGAAGSAAYTYQAVAPPGAPRAVSAVAAERAATLTWVAPAGPVTGYVVTPFRLGVMQRPWHLSGDLTGVTVTGLDAGVPYTFTVTALNDSGAGPRSAASAAVVPGPVPQPPGGGCAVHRPGRCARR